MSKTVYLECDVRIGSVKDYDDNPLDFRVSTEDNEIVITVDIKDFALTPHNVLNYVNDSDNMKEILSESCGSGLESAAYEIVHHLSENDDHHYRSLLSDLCLTPDEEIDDEIDAEQVADYLTSAVNQNRFIAEAGPAYKLQLMNKLIEGLRTDDQSVYDAFLTNNGLMVDSTPPKQEPIKVGYIYRCLDSEGAFNQWEYITEYVDDTDYPVQGINSSFTLGGKQYISSDAGFYLVLDSGIKAPDWISQLKVREHVRQAVDTYMKSTLVS